MLLLLLLGFFFPFLLMTEKKTFLVDAIASIPWRHIRTTNKNSSSNSSSNTSRTTAHRKEEKVTVLRVVPHAALCCVRNVLVWRKFKKSVRTTRRYEQRA
jgi:hypothetical protein